MNPQQAGTMLHPAAEPRNATSTMPDLAAGHRGLLRSLASDTALGPSTTWVPPSGRLAYILTNNHPLTSIPLAALNCGSTKSGQDHTALLPSPGMSPIRSLVVVTRAGLPERAAS